MKRAHVEAEQSYYDFSQRWLNAGAQTGDPAGDQLISRLLAIIDRLTRKE